MPSWYQLSVFVALAAAFAPAAEGSGRGHTHRVHISGQKSKTTSASTLATTSYAPTRNVIVEMFQWSWDSVAQECTNFLGPAGYGYVQGSCRHALTSYLHLTHSPAFNFPCRNVAVSPPQEHIIGDQWWTDYQVVSYQLTSKHGTRDQFQNMINTCHNAGVKVIAGVFLRPSLARVAG